MNFVIGLIVGTIIGANVALIVTAVIKINK
jgi:tetrahydromethanopterin S-methyltransferase subunit B